MWTPATGRQHSRNELRYETDLTNIEWALIGNQRRLITYSFPVDIARVDRCLITEEYASRGQARL
jgi:hypothetical protein